METNQCNGLSQPAVWKTRAGKLLYATVQGVAIVDPKAIIFNEIAPLVVLEEVKVNDRLIDSTETLTLEPGQGERLEFRYSGLSMQSPEDIQFRYYLEGFDRSWIEAQNRRVAYYTNIPPGTYTFRVIAANGDGVWNEVGDSVSFQIQPYFYQTVWFPIVLVLLALTLIGLAHLWRLQRLETQNKRLVSLVKARTLDLARANTKLKKLSEIDGLTGVANRRKFDETMNEEWKRAYRQQTLLSLLLIDLDFFKQYNDTYGHLEGDEVLKQVATELQSGARRAGDLVARYGGEEFVILIPAAKPEEAELYAERVRQRIEAVAIPHASSQISEKLTISIGVASIQPQQGTTPEDFFLSADRALYRAKDEGRNRISRDQPGLGSDTTISSGPN